jgi:hypothetical protein
MFLNQKKGVSNGRVHITYLADKSNISFHQFSALLSEVKECRIGSY